MDLQREHFPTVLRGDVAMEGGSERCNITSFEDGEKGHQLSISVCLYSSFLARMQDSQGPETCPAQSCIPGTQHSACHSSQ